MENNIVNSSTTVNNNATSKKNKSNEIKDKSNKWRIEIPKIGLNAPIKEGTTPEILLEAVGHFTETTKDKEMLDLLHIIEDMNVTFLKE